MGRIKRFLEMEVEHCNCGLNDDEDADPSLDPEDHAPNCVYALAMDRFIEQCAGFGVC